jgi:serine protein kinase
VFDRASLNAELEKIEKPAGISNPKDFRNEIVNFVLRARANNAGKNPPTSSCACSPTTSSGTCASV